MAENEPQAVAGPPTAPPDRPSAVWNRRLIIGAFWFVVVCLGLPHWTWTTSIQRSSLPLESMNAWAEGNACQLQYPLNIELKTSNVPSGQTSDLATRLETLLNAEDRFSLHKFNVVTGTVSTNSALTVQLDSSSANSPAKATLRSWEPVLDVSHQLQTPEDLQNTALFLAGQIFEVFEDESAALSHLLDGTPFSGGRQAMQLSVEKKQKLDGRTTRAFKPASSYHLTFSLFTPGASPSAWEIDQALKEYIQPLLNPLSSVSKFTIDTQVQLYAAFSPSISGPVFDEDRNRWSLHYSDLTGFVNAAEWPLSPGIGSGPTINFVLYHPSADKAPLLIAENDGTSWIIPQWGAVQIHNPPPGQNTTKLTLEDLRPDMLVFADQLASLLGVPPSPPSLSLRISSLARERATALILSASSTLGALSRLTLKLTSIEIPTSVAKSVDETLTRLDRACQDLQQGNFQSALENARIAETEVEKAFFEPSMVGQVYFPEEHKVAVYVPLLGPMAVPLVLSAINQLKSLRDRKKAKTG
ncbi:unnamed protein product [Zymoseptoria tritici ST99CH_3D1]|nr:unnamed protein product [Zymoseptoria tritici ST99CH_3D1]